MQTRASAEQNKYEQIWSFSDYNKFSPGETYATLFEGLAKDKSKMVLDIGCGMGKGGLALRSLGYNVAFLDIAKVNDALEPFTQAPLWSNWPRNREVNFQYGYCCDVLEHIPTEYVCLSIHQILEACNEVFFSVGLDVDGFGTLIEADLHLTVRPYTWWRDLLKEFGDLQDARDFGTTGIYYLSR